ncbi:MAG: hypothetical protein P8Z36_06005 [Gemmatimonadota bacterium]|jgi:hypothetical protein
MEPDRMDLSLLGLAANRWEARVRSILAAASPELARRAALGGPLGLMAMWARPVLRIAAVLAVLAAAVIVTQERATAVAAQAGGVTEALDIPAPVAEWITNDRGPTTGDLLIAMEGNER